MKTFIQFSIDNHDGHMPDNGYLLEQLNIINEYLIKGISALGPNASDETGSYCIGILAPHLRTGVPTC
jgi:hypothetical protein